MSAEDLVGYLIKIGTFLVYTTAICSSIYYYKYKHTFLKYLSLILWYVVINETIGYYLKEYTDIDNTLAYNIYYLIYFSFLLLLYRKYIKTIIYKKWITAFLCIYIISFILNAFNQNYLHERLTIPYTIGGILIIISIIFYFLEILNTNKVLHVTKNLLFWISIGLLLLFVGTIPIRFIVSFWGDSKEYNYQISIVSFILNIAMYLFIIIGFISSKKDSEY